MPILNEGSAPELPTAGREHSITICTITSPSSPGPVSRRQGPEEWGLVATIWGQRCAGPFRPPFWPCPSQATGRNFHFIKYTMILLRLSHHDCRGLREEDGPLSSRILLSRSTHWPTWCPAEAGLQRKFWGVFFECKNRGYLTCGP